MTYMPQIALERIERPRRFARVLLWTIAGFITLLIIWASIARVDEVTRAQGKIISSRQLQIVSNLEGGIIKEILVRQGDRVGKDQPLLRLDATQFSSQFLKDQGNYNALVAQIRRLEAEVEGRPPAFDPSLVAAAPDIVEAEQSLYLANQSNLNAALQTAAAKLEQAQQAALQAQVDAQTKSQSEVFANQEVAMLKPLVEMGSEAKITLLRAQNDARKAAGDYAASRLGVGRAQAAVAQASSELRSVRDDYRSKAFAELSKAKTDLSQTGRELPALQDRVLRAEVRAPIAGTVNRVLASTVNGVVKPGEPLVEIVPFNDTLVVEARVRPSDIGFVRVGQKVLIKISAYDFAVYGGVQGRIEGISSDAVADDGEKKDQSYYIVRVRALNPLVSPGGQRLSMTPGMTAEVDILGDKRSIISYLLTPITRLQQTAFRER
jgi:adhesin transport system membrane fusion protein